ncbi:MAG TPA: hypothetical protein VHC72_12190 [Bryobacteraceae bacterium]|nr:hypothetical protein [Bryobacteraceae bacterium]
MKRFLPSGLIVFAGILGIATATVQSDQDVTKNRKKLDLRAGILRKFLRDKHCPDQAFSEMFIAESDAHGLDWRLLPSLAFVESGGGRTAKGNNLFGWANGKRRFNSIGDAIHTVAAALAHGKPYRGKDIGGKLAAYNEGVDYPAMVLAVMRQISPRADVPSAD